jgi:methylmalonyl-CoA carboxyltransferase large subunit
MTSDTAVHAAVIETLEALRLELVRLSARVAALEADAGARSASTVASTSAPRAGDGISEGIIAVISAALAAYLGVKPHIRQISLIGGASWAQQGRVTIQASHALAVRHD